MKTTLDLLRRGWAGLGTCGLCMRRAFQFAAVAWLVPFTLWIAGAQGRWVVLAVVLAVSATALWLCHLTAFSVRTVWGSSNASAEVGGSHVSRRRAVRE